MGQIPPPPPPIKPRKSWRAIIREIIKRPIDWNDDIFFSYNAGLGEYGARRFFDANRAPMPEIHLGANDTLVIDEPPLPPDAPDTWRCAYCDRENHGDRLTCAGCQAGRPVRPARVARVRVTTYKGVPISKLSEAELVEAAEYLVSEPRHLHAALTTNTAYGGYVEQGTKQLSRAILKRTNQVMRLR